jgi:hypothetical protein
MLDLPEVRAALLKRTDHKQISIDTGISYATLWKVANDRQGDFMYSIIKRLGDYLTQEAK